VEVVVEKTKGLREQVLVVTRDEFRHGCDVINSLLPPEDHIHDIDHLLDLLDFDGSDGIELNEFFEVRPRSDLISLYSAAIECDAPELMRMWRNWTARTRCSSWEDDHCHGLDLSGGDMPCRKQVRGRLIKVT
jgi:hypothetical protein